MPARRAKPRRSGYFEDPGYLDFLRTERLCGVRRVMRYPATPCSGRQEPDHRRRGVGGRQRAPDPCSHSLCHGHHMERHAHHSAKNDGSFREMTHDDLDDFIDARIAEDQAAYYGRPLTDSDLPTVRSTVEAGGITRGLFGLVPPPPF